MNRLWSLLAFIIGGTLAGLALSSSVQALPESHLPTPKLTITPAKGVKTGQLVHVSVHVMAQPNDRLVAIPPQFTPLEVHAKTHTHTKADNRIKHEFRFDLLPLAPGFFSIPSIEIQVLSASGNVGSIQTSAQTIQVQAWLANEPQAKLKGVAKHDISKPVSVWQDDYTLVWVGGGLLALLLAGLLALALHRFWKARQRTLTPPSPPRPPWDIAQEKLETLWQEREPLFEQNRGAELVDRLSDIVREYLGLRYDFEGLESTTDEVLSRMRRLRPTRLSLETLAMTLSECDLVKFAKADAQRQRTEELFKEIQHVITVTTPQPHVSSSTDGAPPHA